jgi:hypothetical protein
MVSNPLTDPEWADRSVDLIDRVVATVRRYTTQPIVATARGLVFGLLAGFGIIAVIVVLGVGITRGLQEALDAAMPRDAAVWLSYFVLSGLCFLAGTLLMRKRFKPDEESAPCANHATPSSSGPGLPGSPPPSTRRARRSPPS